MTAEERIKRMQELLGIADDKPKVAGPMKQKTPQELYEEEMTMLHKGGSDPRGREVLQKFLQQRFGRRG